MYVHHSIASGSELIQLKLLGKVHALYRQIRYVQYCSTASFHEEAYPGLQTREWQSIHNYVIAIWSDCSQFTQCTYVATIERLETPAYPYSPIVLAM